MHALKIWVDLLIATVLLPLEKKIQHLAAWPCSSVSFHRKRPLLASWLIPNLCSLSWASLKLCFRGMGHCISGGVAANAK